MHIILDACQPSSQKKKKGIKNLKLWKIINYLIKRIHPNLEIFTLYFLFILNKKFVIFFNENKIFF